MTTRSAFGRRLPVLLVSGGLLAGALGFGAAVAAAQPPADPNVGEPVPSWAPRKTAEMWAGHPVVWTSAWGGRWGVWINGMFITLSSNPVTNGG
jgi:hypothetical protein